MGTSTLRTDEWAEALAEVTRMGTTHRHYRDKPESDAQIWERAQHHYNMAIRRPKVVDRRVVGPADPAEPLPKEPVAALIGEVRAAYDTNGAELPLIDLERLADMLRDDNPYATVYVAQTGGGCATLYVGPLWKDEHGNERYSVAVGSGWFDQPEWRQGYASPDELYVGRDDDGQSETTQVTPGSTLWEIAELIRHHAALSTALAKVETARREIGRDARLRRQVYLCGRVGWGRQLAPEECEVLRDTDPQLVGGDNEWKQAVYVYHLTRPAIFAREGDPENPMIVDPGAYVRLVEAKRVRGWQVDNLDAAKAYALAVEEEYKAHTES